ncbi:SE1561 family protein [Lysinibacillus sp. MHQ-1]|nr:SE1561 family protein [Lysinibacillus sp. MHQ-1]
MYECPSQSLIKKQQVTYLRERLEMFLEVLDALDPETAELDDIDRLIQMMDDLEDKMEQFNAREQ